MRNRWGWIPRSLYPLATIRTGVPRRSADSFYKAGRFYRLGVERLEDRHLLNAGPLSMVGDAAMSLLPALTNTLSDDVRLSDGSGNSHASAVPLENHGSAFALENHASSAALENQLKGNADDVDDAPPAASQSSPSQALGSVQSDNGVHVGMSVSQTMVTGNAVVKSSVSLDMDSANPQQVSVKFAVTIEEEEAAEPPVAASNWQSVTISNAAPLRTVGSIVLLELDEPTVQNAPQEARSAAMSADANKSRADRDMAAPDLSGLAMTAAKIEARETAQTVAEESRAAMPTTAAVASNSMSPVAAYAGSHEIELVAIAAIDAFGSHFFVPALVNDKIDPGVQVHVAADVGLVEDGEALLNVHEPAPAEEVALAKTPLAGVEVAPASLLDSLPVDFRAVDQALDELLSEIEDLGGNLTAWLDVTTMPPWAIAAGVAAATGVGGLYIRRTRLRRARQQQLDEDSTSWLFTQSHGFATGSTL